MLKEEGKVRQRSVVEAMEADLQLKQSAEAAKDELRLYLAREAEQVLNAYLVAAGWNPKTIDMEMAQIVYWKGTGGYSVRLHLSPRHYVHKDGAAHRPDIVVHLEGRRDPVYEMSLCAAISVLINSSCWRKSPRLRASDRC